MAHYESFRRIVAVRARLTHALRLDLIGPEPDEPQAAEILVVPPSRWYLTGFLVPWTAPARRSATRTSPGRAGFRRSGGGTTTRTSPAIPRRRHARATSRRRSASACWCQPTPPRSRVTARWGDYPPLERRRASPTSSGARAGSGLRPSRLRWRARPVPKPNDGPRQRRTRDRRRRSVRVPSGLRTWLACRRARAPSPSSSSTAATPIEGGDDLKDRPSPSRPARRSRPTSRSCPAQPARRRRATTGTSASPTCSTAT